LHLVFAPPPPPSSSSSSVTSVGTGFMPSNGQGLVGSGPPSVAVGILVFHRSEPGDGETLPGPVGSNGRPGPVGAPGGPDGRVVLLAGGPRVTAGHGGRTSVRVVALSSGPDTVTVWAGRSRLAQKVRTAPGVWLSVTLTLENCTLSVTIGDGRMITVVVVAALPVPT
jgi:hypothetical protein